MNEWLEKVREQFSNPWQYVGISGQLLFGCRFVVQWIATERAKKSVVPVAFWHISILATLVSLTYGIGDVQLPIMMGNVLNLFIYFRNLSFIYGWGKKEPVSA
ncbi:MAG: lipid-A-disaccharide synthase N-terminal domain-containing protein [Planctomycetota bacterium]